MIYKVYAQNINRPKGTAIAVIEPQEVGNYIDEQVTSYFNSADLDYLPHDEDDSISDETFTKAYEAVYELLDDIWNRDKTLYCGDFYITEADEAPDRPNMCGDSYGDIQDDEVLKKIN